MNFSLQMLKGKPSCFGIEQLDIREEGALKRSLGLWRSFRVNTEVAGFGVKQI